MDPTLQPGTSVPSIRARRKDHRKGQSLVEFALTLPILLLMIFGIIEFGRIFQAWVSLQNAARAAARYASTGAANYDLYQVTNDPNINDDIEMTDYIVPCDDNADNAGNPEADIGTSSEIDLDGVHKVIVYNGGDGFFATWYDGTDCDPANEEHQQYRKDIMRLLSIMFEAREAVNSLGVEWLSDAGDGIHYFEQLTPEAARKLLTDNFQLLTYPRQDQRGWFNVQMCSSRGLLNPVAGTAANPRTLHPEYSQSRYITVRSDADLLGIPKFPEPPVTEEKYSPVKYPMLPYCMLNEIPPPPLAGADDYSANNSGKRWLDAGGPGERVTVMVTFNHPLITPLRLPEENFLTMQSRRSIVNESFRAPKAIGAFQKSLPPGSGGIGTVEPPGEPTETLTPTNTMTFTQTPSNTPTYTPEPFDCDNLELIWGSPPFNSNRMYFQVTNGNFNQTTLLQVKMQWNDLNAPYDQMYIGAMSLGSDIHWVGSPGLMDNSQPGVTSVDTGVLGQGFRVIAAGDTAIWEALFFSGPSNLSDYMSLNDLIYAEFTFDHPESDVDCKILLYNPPPEGEPTETPSATVGPSPTNTPGCVDAVNTVQMKFGGFGTLGGVYFIITNNSGRDLNVSGFNFVWPDSDHPDIKGEPTGGYRLAKVLLGGTDVLSGQPIWSAATPADDTGNTKTGPPYNGGTDSANEGTWIANGTMPPGETWVWLDFDSIPGQLSSYGAKNFHFDLSRIRVSCQSSGGGGGGGGGDSGEDEIDVPIPSPTITNTPKPTNTTGPSNTPKPATKTWTPTLSKTPAPPTFTATQAPVTFTPSKTPLGQATVPGGGGGE